MEEQLLNFESTKEEGEISDEDENSVPYPVNTSKSNDSKSNAFSNLPKEKQQNVRYHDYDGPSGPPTQFFGRSNRPKQRTGSARFLSNYSNANRDAQNGPTALPPPQNILPSLLELKTKPSSHLRATEQWEGGHQTPKITPCNTTPREKQYIHPSAYVPSPSLKLWENRRKRISKEEAPQQGENFEELLQSYKDVQEQLAVLRREEEGQSNQVADKIPDAKRATPEHHQKQTGEEASTLPSVALGANPASSVGAGTQVAPVELGTQPATVQADRDSKALEDEDDEELDELELRRIALASAAEKMLQTEAEENQSVEGSPDKAENGSIGNQSTVTGSKPQDTQQTRQTNSTRTSTDQSYSKRKPAKPRESRYDGRPHRITPRSLRSRTPAQRIRKSALSYSSKAHYRSEDRFRRPSDPSRNKSSAHHSYSSKCKFGRRESSRPDQRDRPSEPDRGAEKGERVKSGESQTREIQKILTLDDPDEQVARFLALLDRRLATGSGGGGNSDGSSSKGKQVTSVQLQAAGVVEADTASSQTKDNYEEVEMDIDSDPESAAVTNPVDELQFEPDFYSAMMPPSFLLMPPPFEPYDPVTSWAVPGPSYSAPALHQYPLPPIPGVSLSDTHIPQLYREPARDLIHPPPPPPPPPPPEDPPPQPPLPPSLPPLPASPPPPLPSEPPPPPPPPSINSLEDHIQQVLPSLSLNSLPDISGVPSLDLSADNGTSKQGRVHSKPSFHSSVSSTCVTQSTELALASYLETVKDSVAISRQTQKQSSNQNYQLDDMYSESKYLSSGNPDLTGSVSQHSIVSQPDTTVDRTVYQSNLESSRSDPKDIVTDSYYAENSADSEDLQNRNYNTNVSTTAVDRGSYPDQTCVQDEVVISSDSKLAQAPEKVEKEDEDEEAKLRAQLIQSMERRRKEKEKLEMEAKSSLVTMRSESPNILRSRSDSPSLPRAASSSSLSYSRSRHHVPYAQPHTLKFPVHKPVIIRLGDDTSSDEEVEPAPCPPPSGVQKLIGGIDMFLKAARRSSEIQTDSSSLKLQQHQHAMRQLEVARHQEVVRQQEARRKELLTAQVRQRELQLMSQSKTIAKDQTRLKSVLNRAAKHHQNVKTCEDKVKLLREQLAAAEKLTAANQGALENIKKQARHMKDALLKKMTEHEETKQQLITAGKALYGDGYQLGFQPPQQESRVVHATNTLVVTSNKKPQTTAPQKKRVKKNMTITIDNTNTPGSPKATTSQATVKLTADSDILNKKKAKLQQIAAEYEKKLRELEERKRKAAQTLDKSKAKDLNGVFEKKSDISRNVLRLEKIEFGRDMIDLTSEVDENVVKRRRSLMEMNPSMRPDLEVKSSVQRSTSLEGKENQIEVKIPEGKSLSRIVKQQRMRIDEELKNLCQKCKEGRNYPEFPALGGKSLQVSSLQPYKTPSRSAITTSNQTSTTSAKFTYKSPLLHFKAYRFSPYFRTKAWKQLTSRSYCHKLLPKKILCRFDLQGTCNDEQCHGQHKSQFTMSEREILHDIVSYSPSLAGLQNGTPAKKIPKIIGDYVDQLLLQNQGRLKLDEMCLLLTSRVTENAKHTAPHTMFYTSRLFRPQQEDKTNIQAVGPDLKHNKDPFAWLIPDQVDGKAVSRKLEDSVVNDDDQRYFYSDYGGEVQDLESAVIACPTHVQLWLKLANKKLNNSNMAPDQCLDAALNVLARGLETNKESSSLWLEYLTLYSRHRDAADFSHLCQTALQYAASFLIWWKYLHSLACYTDRNEVCSEMVDYLCGTQDRSHLNPAISHHLLEVMLYKANLSVITGHVQYAKNILQGYFVKSEGRHSCQSFLTVEDRCVLWLSYIHLMSCDQLPDILWHSNHYMSGKIFSKKKIILPWSRLSSPSFSADQQMALLQEAVNVCITSQLDSNPGALQEGLLLYQNIIQLLQTQNKLEEMLTVCRDLLQQDQSLVDIWLVVANLYGANGELQATQQVLKDATEVNPLSAKVFHFAAQFMLQQAETDSISSLEQCPLGYFHAGQSNASTQTLYCTLLKQTLPLGETAPDLQQFATGDSLRDQLVYLWLNYCLYLELKKDYSMAIEMYETALSSLVTVEDIARIWSGYLMFQCRLVINSTKPGAEVENRRLNSLVHRCVSTMPVKLEVPHWPGELMTDYSHLNSVVETYIHCLVPELRVVALERLISKMANNVPLVLRVCEEGLLHGDDQKALSMCYPLLYEVTSNIQIWKLVTSLAIKQGSQNQVQKLFQKAVQAVPYSLQMWKNSIYWAEFLTYELTQGERAKETIHAILSQCEMLGLNMSELLKLLTSPGDPPSGAS